MEDPSSPPLIAHVIYSLGIGGLENGLVNLINRMPADRYRHVIICLKDSTDFCKRIRRGDVQVFELHKKAGQDWASFLMAFRLFKKLRPAIVHTRNLAAFEYQVPAFLAGVKGRIQGEHGWDVFDPEGHNKKYQWLRRLLGFLIHRFIPLSRHLENYLLEKIQIHPSKISRICNGVDTGKFYPRIINQQEVNDWPFPEQNTTCIGTVGRMHGVKDQLTLVNAFIELAEREPRLIEETRLVIVGDGPLRDRAIQRLKERDLFQYAWLPGKRNDIAEIMRSLDIFVLPSQAEGISNTILEAMASGLPVVATDVGGNSELIDHDRTGYLVEKENPKVMADYLLRYVVDPQKRKLHGNNGYEKVLAEFSIDAMVAHYMSVYDEVSFK